MQTATLKRAAPAITPPSGDAAPRRNVLVDPRRLAPRPAGQARVPRPLQRLLGPALLLLAWHLLASLDVFDPRTTPAPLTVLRTAADLAASGVLLDNLLASLQLVFKGLALGLSVGLIAAVVAGLSRAGKTSSMPIWKSCARFPTSRCCLS